MKTSAFPGFPPQTLEFLAQLARNNHRDWFAENKDRYEDRVRAPALAFITAMQAPMNKISDCFRVEPKRMGGSLMRVYRDTRFSKDKTPYKTNVGIQFRHIAGKDVHAPGYYVHIAPDEIFVGAGLWHPDGSALKAIREAIDNDQAGWKRAVNGKRLREKFELAGDSLKRPPRGYDADHPLITDLKRKDFIVISSLQEKDIESPKFTEQVTRLFQAAGPLMRFLCRAVDLPF